MMIFIGVLFILASGAMLHDVPFLRFVSALLLLTAGQTFLMIGLK